MNLPSWSFGRLEVPRPRIEEYQGSEARCLRLGGLRVDQADRQQHHEALDPKTDTHVSAHWLPASLCSHENAGYFFSRATRSLASMKHL